MINYHGENVPENLSFHVSIHITEKNGNGAGGMQMKHNANETFTNYFF